MLLLISDFFYSGDVYFNHTWIEISLNIENKLMLLKANDMYHITNITLAHQDMLSLLSQIVPYKKRLNPKAKSWRPKIEF